MNTETRSDRAGTLIATIRITRTNAARRAVRTDLPLQRQPQQRPLLVQPPPPQSEPPPHPLPQPPRVGLQPQQFQWKVSSVNEYEQALVVTV